MNAPDSKIPPDKLDALLVRFEHEQKEFENHWLWRELGTPPKVFFAKIQETIETSGIDKTVWQAKLAEAKQVIETRVKERERTYAPMNYKTLTGLRA